MSGGECLVAHRLSASLLDLSEQMSSWIVVYLVRDGVRVYCMESPGDVDDLDRGQGGGMTY